MIFISSSQAAFRLKRGIIEVRKTDGALDLQRALALEKNRRRMRLDPMDIGVRCRVRPKCKDALLNAGVGCYGRYHPQADLGFEDCCAQKLSGP